MHLLNSKNKQIVKIIKPEFMNLKKYLTHFNEFL
jgi:hypothetical protein